MKYKILMPCFNDWASVSRLLEKIDNEVSNIDGEFDVIIVNDGSNEKIPKTSKKYKVLKSVKVINMKFNQGHTRSNATGIKYLSRKNDFDYLILMDGDGEDRPEEIKLLIEKALSNKKTSVVARRVKRSEGLIFTFFYNLHKLITLIFTGRNINFGHYSCITKEDIINISSKKSLWINYSGTVKKFVKKIDNIPCVRGKRYVQPSKMSFNKLVVHAFSIWAVFKYQVLVRSVLFFLISFLFISLPYTIAFGLMLTTFTMGVFLSASQESSEKLENSEKNIANIETTHTTKL